MAILTSFISKITRKAPVITNVARKILPLSLKRYIGKYLLSIEEEGGITHTEEFKFITIPDRVFLQVVYDGIFEPSLTNIIEKYISKEDTCVDVGANFGWFSIYMGSRCNHVIAYEPAERIYNILLQNVELNLLSNKVESRKIAIGNEEGNITFVIEGDAKSESALGYVTSDNNIKHEHTETVQITTLDKDLERFFNNIALMKIDTEGNEYYAFLGAKNILSGDHPPVIITEANRGSLARNNSTREELCSTLVSLGYSLYGMRDNGSIYADNTKKAPALLGIPSKGKYRERALKTYEI